jgi:two-component system cell cycle sensor histidine kinase/response regulator CckA
MARDLQQEVRHDVIDQREVEPGTGEGLRVRNDSNTTGIARDVTEERRTAEELTIYRERLEETEKSLRTSEHKYRDLAEMLPEIVFETDLAGRVTFVNQRGFESFGYSREEFEAGVDIMDVLAPEDRDRAAQNIYRILDGEEPAENEYKMNRKDGGTFPAVVSCIPVMLEGKPVGLRGIVTDIGSVKQSATALVESENKFRDLAERSLVGVYLIQDGVFRYVNPCFAKMYGFTVEELTDKKGPKDLVLEKDRAVVKDWMHAQAKAPERSPVEFRGKTSSGLIFECEAYFSRTVYHGKPAAIGTVVDITGRKWVEDQMLALNHLAFELTATTNIQEAFDVCLRSLLNASGMESGAAYAANSQTGDLDLICSMGPSKGFKRTLASSEIDAGSTRLFMQGNLIYGVADDTDRLAGLLHANGKALQMVILPILYEGNLVACVCMASPTSEALARQTLSFLEAIASQVKGGVARVWAEGAMRKSAEKYWTLLDGAPDAILLADTDGSILEVNRKAEEIFGYEKGEFLGKNYAELLRPVGLNKVRNGFRKIAEGGSVPITDIWMRRKDRSLVPLSVTASMVEFGGRRLVHGVFRDITEKKRASMALRESEEKYRMLMDNANDAVIHLGPHGTIIESNKKACTLLGYAKEELLGMDYAKLGPGLSSGEIADTLKAKSADGTLYDSCAAQKDGALVPVDLSWNKVRIRGRSVVQVVIRSIRRRKKVEDALRVSEAKYRTVFENTGTAMVIFEKDMTISFVNTEFERMSGFPRTAIEGVKNWSDLILDHAQQKGSSHLRCISSSDESLSSGLVPAVGPQSFRAVISGRKDNRKHVLVSIAALPDSDKSIASLIDISQLIYAEEVLKQSEERYRALVHQSSEGIFIVEPRTKKLMEANEPFMNMLGYEPDDIQNLSLYDLIMESKSFIDASVGKAMQKGQYFMGERNFRGKNGLVVDVDVATSAVTYGNSTFIMMSFRDITEKKQMEGMLNQAQKMEAIGTLAGGIAHDFNNILQVITGCAYQLSMKLKGGETAPLASLAEQVLSSSEKASQLTQSILTFSRKQQIDPKPIDLNSTIKSVEKFLKRIIGEEIELVPEYSPDSLLIMADQVQIEQILMNVATNARDAMPGGGLLRITASLEEIGDLFVKTRGYGAPGAYACISVSDTGGGMDEETKRRIFEPFYTTKKLGKGTGLGMAVVYGIVKQHKAYIDVESQPGTGTTIKVYFPLAAITHGETHADEESGPVTGGTETILLAEDEKDVRVFLKGILEEAGYRVIEAENGDDAVERYAMHKDEVHLALLDVVMPKKNGKQAYDEMRKVKRNIKAVFMSGYNEETIHRKGILRTGTALLSKPVPPALLLSKIRETLHS